MRDRFLILYSPMADFSTAPWGVLEVVDGKVVLDEAKAFNRARLALDSGANMFRILRRGVWSIQVPFDCEDVDYWNLFRRYLSILHMPVQGTWYLDGADVLVEIFDGCSESWMYDPANYGKARQLIQAMFSHLGDLPYIKFGMGNEMQKAESVEFAEKVVYPEFKLAGRIPFSYGATYSTKDDLVEKQKAKASLAWNPPGAPDYEIGDAVAESIYKQVHGVRDKDSIHLTDTVSYWVNHPLCTIWSVDGVFDGASDCDYYEDENGKRKTRPSVAQWKSAVKYVLDYAKRFALSAGQVKFGFEYLPKAINADECSAKGVLAISEEYKAKWRVWPENFGKYPNDWTEPIPPEPPEPEPPIPPTPEPIEKPCCYYWNRHNYWHWLRCVLFGKH